MRSGKEQERRKTSINLPLADSLPPVLRILTWPDFPGGSVINVEGKSLEALKVRENVLVIIGVSR